MLIRKFHRCSFQVKITLFKTYCSSMYDIALWTRYSQHCVNRFRSAILTYISGCMKMFFGYSRRDSITQILLITGLLLHNAKQVFKQCIESCSNSLILMFSSLQAGCVGCM